MSSADSSGPRLGKRTRIWADAVTYALAVAGVAVVVALVLGIATGGGVVRAKVILFVAGWALLSYSTVRLWPTSMEDVESSDIGESIPRADDATRFQSFARTLPPARWIQLPHPEERLSPPGKLMLGSILILLLSFLLETGFGIS